MKIILFSLGTRGDIEPFLGIAEILSKHNCEIICVFPEQFRSIVEELSYNFYGFSKAFLGILVGQTGQLFMGGSGNLFQRISAFIKIAKEGIRLQDEIVGLHQKILLEEKPDIILYHPKCLFSIIWGMAHPGRSIQVSPLPYMTHSTSERTAMGLKGNSNKGKVINLFSHSFTNWIKSIVIYRYGRKYFKDYPNVKYSPGTIRRTLRNTEKTIYPLSPTLFKRPEDWKDHVYISGYIERDKTTHFVADPELLSFIKLHNRILFISFGSMTNTKTMDRSRMMVEVLQKHGIPTIISTSWGGMKQTDDAPENILFTNDIPYDWLLPRVYAIVHHGGAGTIHSATKYACPSLILPHFVDQFYWNERISEMGLGPKGVRINKLNYQIFEEKILDLMNNQNYKNRARELSQKMKNEFDEQSFSLLILEN